MLDQPSDIIPFVIGLVIGALGTVSVFRSGITALDVKVTTILERLATIEAKQTRHETDFNNVVDKLRKEIKDAVDDYRRHDSN